MGRALRCPAPGAYYALADEGRGTPARFAGAASRRSGCQEPNLLTDEYPGVAPRLVKSNLRKKCPTPFRWPGGHLTRRSDRVSPKRSQTEFGNERKQEEKWKLTSSLTRQRKSSTNPFLPCRRADRRRSTGSFRLDSGTARGRRSGRRGDSAQSTGRVCSNHW